MDKTEYMGKVGKVQELNLELIRLASFNEFDGEQVVKDLLANRELWHGVVMDRAGFCLHGVDGKPMFNEKGGEKINLIKLRDIEADYWNVDTLYVLVKEGKEKEMEALAKSWHADEVDYEDKEWSTEVLGSSVGGKILRVWWD